MGTLAVTNLTKRLGGNLVVDGVSFRVEDGEFLALLGPSGGGKSTLLRLICGLETPDNGEVIIDGRPATTLPPRERNLGMVFQDYGLYPNMNVYENMAYGLQARNMPAAEIERRVVMAAERLGLAALLRRGITELSGGEQQRVALGRAMARDASAFLFDEPLSNLDPKLRHQARRDILALHREKRKPSLYVTHDQTEAFAMGDRIGVVGRGRLQQIGRAEDLLNEPANLFVAGFVGSPPMNLLWGEVVRGGDGYLFRGNGVTLALPAAWNAALGRRADARVIVGFRPDALAVATANAPFAIGPANTIETIVADVEALIGETVVVLRAGDTTLAALFSDDIEPVAGQLLRVGVDPDRLRLFDPDSEQAILHEPSGLF